MAVLLQDRLSEDDKKDIIDSYIKRYESIKSIALRYNTREDTMSKFIKSLGIEISVRRKPMYLNWSEEIRQEFIQEYLNGNSVSSLARKMKCSQAPLEKLFRDYNIEIRSIHRYNKVNLDFWKKINTEDKAYWLGMMYSDGWLSKKVGRPNEPLASFGLSLKIDDIDHIKKFRKSLESEQDIYFLKKNEIPYMAVLRINAKEMAEDLVRLGCSLNKTYNLKYPSMDILPSELQHHFIRGVFDGDGCIRFDDTHKMVNITGTKTLLEGIIQYLQPTYHYKIYNKGIYSLLYIYSMNGILDFYKKIYYNMTVCLDRKNKIFIDLINKYTLQGDD